MYKTSVHSDFFLRYLKFFGFLSIFRRSCFIQQLPLSLKNTRAGDTFDQSITVTLTEDKKRSSVLDIHLLQSTCFGTQIETGVDSKEKR